jgi:hypothetical protein
MFFSASDLPVLVGVGLLVPIDGSPIPPASLFDQRDLLIFSSGIDFSIDVGAMSSIRPRLALRVNRSSRAASKVQHQAERGGRQFLSRRKLIGAADRLLDRRPGRACPSPSRPDRSTSPWPKPVLQERHQLLPGLAHQLGRQRGTLRRVRQAGHRVGDVADHVVGRPDLALGVEDLDAELSKLSIAALLPVAPGRSSWSAWRASRPSLPG